MALAMEWAGEAPPALPRTRASKRASPHRPQSPGGGPSAGPRRVSGEPPRRIRQKLDSRSERASLRGENFASCWGRGLPALVCQAVFASLGPAEVASARSVCRSWSAAVSDAQTELCLTPVLGADLPPQGMLQAFPQLRSVRWIDDSISGASAPVTGILCASLSPAASTLANLDLSDCGSIGDSAVSAVSCFESLRCLDLASTQVTDGALAETISALSNLTDLNLCGCPGVTDAGIEALSAGTVAKSLTSLNLSSDLLEIETVDMHKITDRSMAGLGMIKNLRYLNLSGAQGVTSAGLQHLSNSTGLVSLNLSRTQVDSEGIRALSGLSRLSTLCLSHTSVDDGALAMLSRMPSMTYLDLVGCESVTDTGLIALGSRGLGLQYLNVSDCAEVTDKGLKGLSSLVTLSTLCLGSYVGEDYLHVTDEGMRWIGRLTNLTRLDLHECSPDITEKGVQHLRSLSKLESLTLARCPGICDTALASIGHLRALQHLDISSCRGVTGAGLVSLQQLPLLLDLRLPKSKHFADNVLSSFVMQLPVFLGQERDSRASSGGQRSAHCVHDRLDEKSASPLAL